MMGSLVLCIIWGKLWNEHFVGHCLISCNPQASVSPSEKWEQALCLPWDC